MAHIHDVYDNDEYFQINEATREISRKNGGMVRLIQYDHNSERLTFEVPQYADGHDLSLCNIVQVHYVNLATNKKDQNVGVYEVDDFHSSEDKENTLVCSWLISNNATQYVGTLSFILRFICTTGDTVDYAWNTGIYSGITVSDGMYNGDIVVSEYADILEVWRKEVIGEERVIRAVKSYLEDNPVVTHSWDGSVLRLTTGSGTTLTDLQGPQGPVGVTGAPGPAGEQGLGIYRTTKNWSEWTSEYFDFADFILPPGYVPKVNDLVVTANNYLCYVYEVNTTTDTFTVASFMPAVSLNGAPGPAGADGADGQDGVSPAITVTDITGGHRVTIEDAFGTKTFDVMDGQGGGEGGTVVQGNWEQNDPEASDYIKGRTHWLDNDGYHPLDGHYLPESVPWTEDQSAVLLEPAQLMFDSGGEVKLDAEIEIYEGGTYVVIWNGAEFECTAELYEQDGVHLGVRLGTGDPFMVLNVAYEMVETVGAHMVVSCSPDYYNQPVIFEIMRRGVFHHKLAPELLPDGFGGGSGIHVGDSAPSDTSMLWVDTSDNEGSTVDSVNGKTGTVMLTAEDVGAMPAGASVDYTLPAATAETLGGVKVGEGLSIDASGVLSASGGGSSGGGGGVPTWSLLGEYDMSTIADTSKIELTGLDNLTYLYFKWEALQNETSTDSGYWLSINGTQLGQYISNRKSGTSNYGYTICKWNGLVWEIQMSAGAISDTNYTLNTGNALFPYNHVFGVGACTTLSALIPNPTYKPVSGVLKIYGGK